ncbi:hypothetical protein EIP91_008079 [Steccherinum ochraceum]|uniref:Uncharacterized protein n=1 Tax=Steccherinum ochraceum TaxID=92696 RepID=A0A4R0RQ63_9APHY|nr:hypothetical protein EIP91_008079 [Steccherinum ochraceum]
MAIANRLFRSGRLACLPPLLPNVHHRSRAFDISKPVHEQKLKKKVRQTRWNFKAFLWDAVRHNYPSSLTHPESPDIEPLWRVSALRYDF